VKVGCHEEETDAVAAVQKVAAAGKRVGSKCRIVTVGSVADEVIAAEFLRPLLDRR